MGRRNLVRKKLKLGLEKTKRDASKETEIARTLTL